MDEPTAQHVLSEITREVESHLLATRAQHPARWATGNLMNEGWRVQLTQTYLLLAIRDELHTLNTQLTASAQLEQQAAEATDKRITRIAERLLRERIDRMFAANGTQALEEAKP